MAEYFGKNGELTSDDLNYFATQRRQVNQNYGYGIDQNQWQRDVSRGEYNRGLEDLRSQYGRMRNSLPSGFAKGGLLNSGIYARALDEFQADRTRNMGNLTAAYNERLGGLALADRQLESIRRNALDDTAAAETARRATVAEALRSIGL